MATDAENIDAAISALTAKIAETYTNPLPSYTLPNGASVDREKYRAGLIADLKALRELKLSFAGPFTATSVVR